MTNWARRAILNADLHHAGEDEIAEMMARARAVYDERLEDWRWRNDTAFVLAQGLGISRDRAEARVERLGLPPGSPLRALELGVDDDDDDVPDYREYDAYRDVPDFLQKGRGNPGRAREHSDLPITPLYPVHAVVKNWWGRGFRPDFGGDYAGAKYDRGTFNKPAILLLYTAWACNERYTPQHVRSVAKKARNK